MNVRDQLAVEGFKDVEVPAASPPLGSASAGNVITATPSPRAVSFTLSPASSLLDTAAAFSEPFSRSDDPSGSESVLRLATLSPEEGDTVPCCRSELKFPRQRTREE